MFEEENRIFNSVLIIAFALKIENVKDINIQKNGQHEVHESHIFHGERHENEHHHDYKHHPLSQNHIRDAHLRGLIILIVHLLDMLDQVVYE